MIIFFRGNVLEVVVALVLAQSIQQKIFIGYCNFSPLSNRTPKPFGATLHPDLPVKEYSEHHGVGEALQLRWPPALASTQTLILRAKMLDVTKEIDAAPKIVDSHRLAVVNDLEGWCSSAIPILGCNANQSTERNHSRLLRNDHGLKSKIEKSAKRRYWTKDEHDLFMYGLRKCGWGRWVDIARIVKTRESTQVSQFT